MLRKILGATKTKLPTAEEWSQQHANKASPDGIIAAIIVESLAKEWDDWKARDLCQKDNSWEDPKLTPTLINTKRSLDVRFGVRTWKKSGGQYHHDTHYVDWQSKGTKVNGIEIELKAARFIVSGYERIAKQMEALKETAAKAEASMKANEAKWNLAESLLGFTRVNGALVPATSIREEKQDAQTTNDEDAAPEAVNRKNTRPRPARLVGVE